MKKSAVKYKKNKKFQNTFAEEYIKIKTRRSFCFESALKPRFGKIIINPDRGKAEPPRKKKNFVLCLLNHFRRKIKNDVTLPHGQNQVHTYCGTNNQVLCKNVKSVLVCRCSLTFCFRAFVITSYFYFPAHFTIYNF